MNEEPEFKKPDFINPVRKVKVLDSVANQSASKTPEVTKENSDIKQDGANSDVDGKAADVNDEHKSNLTNEELEEERRRATIKEHEKYVGLLSKLKYQVPAGAAGFDPRYKIEVLKNGLIVDQINFKPQRSFYVIGRNTQCDIQAEHPTLSRTHAVFQFIGGDEKASSENNESEPETLSGTEGCKEKGLYLYDLSSTHGTFLNKNRVFPNRYYRLRVGHVLKFGNSTRLYIVVGPSEDEEEESEKTVTELLKERLEKDLERKRLAESWQSDVSGRNIDVEEEGISWGMGEDAVEEETDLSVNPFATGFDTSESDLSLDNPKKTLRSWFEREGSDLVYDVKEKSSGHFICRINLPLDGPSGETLFAEVELKGKKKEVVAQCALKACQILDKHGALRQSHQEGYKRKTKDWEEKDYYSSDEDTYLDRTGTVERKREIRMKQAGKIEEKAETFDSLTEKYASIQKEIDSVKAKLDKAIQKSKDEESEVDPLDAYMMDLKTGVSDIKKLKSKLKELADEQNQVQRLLNIVTPATFVPKNSLVQPAKSEVTSMNDEEPAKQSAATENEDEPSSKKIKLLFGPRKPFLKPSDAVKKLSPVGPAAALASTLSTAEIEEDEDSDDDLEEQAKSDSTPKDQDEEKSMGSEGVSQTSIKKKRKRNRQQRPKTVVQHEYDSNNPHYSVWVPPEDQRGDGKTKLNEKLGY